MEALRQQTNDLLLNGDELLNNMEFFSSFYEDLLPIILCSIRFLYNSVIKSNKENAVDLFIKGIIVQTLPGKSANISVHKPSSNRE